MRPQPSCRPDGCQPGDAALIVFRLSPPPSHAGYFRFRPNCRLAFAPLFISKPFCDPHFDTRRVSDGSIRDRYFALVSALQTVQSSSSLYFFSPLYPASTWVNRLSSSSLSTFGPIQFSRDRFSLLRRRHRCPIRSAKAVPPSRPR